jgi:hypothetical protein
MHVGYGPGALVLLAVCLALPIPASTEQAKGPRAETSQGKIKRLILKDGSYELISKYEIRGSRVRYLSSERHEWEEMPSSLVDWPATERHAKEAASESRSRIREVGDSEAKERAREEESTPWVSQGIRLPATGGVFLLDRFAGKAELDLLHQVGADIHKNVGGNILRGVLNPIASSKQSIELKGPHAATQSHVADPSIYVGIDPTDPAADYTAETARDHFRIVRCAEKKGNRIVGVVNIAVYGKVREEASYVQTRVEPISTRWVKVSSANTLQPGEYALVELLGKESINTFVWDFGVNPAAPANSAAAQPEATRSDKPPVLRERKRPPKP